MLPEARGNIFSFANFIIDNFVRYIFAGIVIGVAMMLFGDDIGLILGVTAFFFYHLIFEAAFQKTVGKMLTGTKVVGINGERASFLALFGRTLARYIPF